MTIHLTSGLKQAIMQILLVVRAMVHEIYI